MVAEKSDSDQTCATFVSAYARGYAVAGGDATSQVFPKLDRLQSSNQSTPLEIQLGPECDAEFTVLAPDSKPLAGARVGPPPVLLHYRN